MERPLAGAVICCTSVAPEVRTRLAEYAQQMGAEHKLDLTSDVTHLLVGDTDTLKYKYVAREREDVKVLQLQWVEAVRECWMDAKPIDLDALTTEYRLPTFTGLKICITGFDDLTFRARLQDNVVENGGQYTGDLTKDVTHLIAAKPEGKKYEYGTQWQKKVVSLKWYKDTLARGMQLDESLYHPSKPIDEQGISAWKRVVQPQPQPQLGKHSREGTTVLEPSRKLRRTTSSRLGSQSDTLWTDIVAGGGFETSEPQRPTLKPIKSTPTMRPGVTRMNGDLNLHGDEATDAVGIGNGYLDGKYFTIQGFDRQKQDRLRQILVDQAGTVLDTPEQLKDAAAPSEATKIMIFPYETPAERVKAYSDTVDPLSIVSEFWLEWCMFKRSYVPPEQYPLGSLISQSKPAGFSRLTLNATGFPGIQALQISKMVKLMGAQYHQTFSSKTTALICRKGCDNLPKLSRASIWRVPVVSESWLRSCILESRTAPFEKYLIQRIEITSKSENGAVQDQCKDVGKLREHFDKNHNSLEAPNVGRETFRPGSDFFIREDAVVKHGRTAKTEQDPSKGKDSEGPGPRDAPLREISPNSPTKRPVEVGPKSKKRLFGTLDGPSSNPIDTKAHERSGVGTTDENIELSVAPSLSNQNIAGDIRDFYSMKANVKPSSPKSKRLLGRASSNLSNSSVTSVVRHSRASSVDSVNTDGVGSEIAPLASANGRQQPSGENRSFTGRAKSKLSEDRYSSIVVGDPGLYKDEMVVEEAAPAMTQLLYDESEDTIAVREKVAAQRRQRSRIGQELDDLKPGDLKEPRRIRDDDIIANAGWGAGRRTRHKDKSPPGLKDF